MKDQYGRIIDYMRISLTDRCNLKCRYCMPDEKTIDSIKKEELLTFSERLEIIKTATTLGITHIRLTGGEPLLQKDCIPLIEGIQKIDKIKSVSLTTNGILLKQYSKNLKKANISSINVSLDTVDPEQYKEMTGRDCLRKVLEGIETAKQEEITMKINAVNQKGLDFLPLIAFAEEKEIPIRFIEMMPIGVGKEYIGQSNEELRKDIESHYGVGKKLESKQGNGPAVYYEFPDLKIKIGFISAIHGKFCNQCNRIRLTANGYLKLCLSYDDGVDLKKTLRKKDKKENLQTVMQKNIFRKPKQHCFEELSNITEQHAMVQIGG